MLKKKSVGQLDVVAGKTTVLSPAFPVPDISVVPSGPDGELAASPVVPLDGTQSLRRQASMRRGPSNTLDLNGTLSRQQSGRLGSFLLQKPSTRWAPVPLSRRAELLYPSNPVYNVPLDFDALAKAQCCLFGRCVGNESLHRSFIDIHESQISWNLPTGWCCCVPSDDAHLVHFDRKWFHGVLPEKIAFKAKCCRPVCPLPCMHFCNCFGEVLVIDSGTQCCMDSSVAPGHCDPCWGLNCCHKPIFVGLAEGQAETTAAVLREVLLLNIRKSAASIFSPTSAGPMK